MSSGVGRAGGKSPYEDQGVGSPARSRKSSSGSSSSAESYGVGAFNFDYSTPIQGAQFDPKEFKGKKGERSLAQKISKADHEDYNDLSIGLRVKLMNTAKSVKLFVKTGGSYVFLPTLLREKIEELKAMGVTEGQWAKAVSDADLSKRGVVPEDLKPSKAERQQMKEAKSLEKSALDFKSGLPLRAGFRKKGQRGRSSSDTSQKTQQESSLEAQPSTSAAATSTAEPATKKSGIKRSPAFRRPSRSSSPSSSQAKDSVALSPSTITPQTRSLRAVTQGVDLSSIKSRLRSSSSVSSHSSSEPAAKKVKRDDSSGKKK